MKHETYALLRNAHLGDADEEALMRELSHESDTFTQFYGNVVLQKIPLQTTAWNVDAFTKDFRSGTPRQRLDETVISFLLRMASITRHEVYVKSFQNPGAFSEGLAWTLLLKHLMCCILGLLYNISWTYEKCCMVDEYILHLHHSGKVGDLRHLMKKVGISISETESFPAEKAFPTLSFLNIGQFGSFHWKLFHWMAEAHTLRTGMEDVKTQWRDIVVGPLYRILFCPFCMSHFRKNINDRKEEFLDASADHPRLWFELHNKVHQLRRETYTGIQEPDYFESEYQKDAEFMRQALLDV